MTLGQLYDKLQDIRSAEKDVAAAQKSLDFGGNDDTMHHKRELLSKAEWWLAHIRREEVL